MIGNIIQKGNSNSGTQITIESPVTILNGSINIESSTVINSGVISISNDTTFNFSDTMSEADLLFLLNNHIYSSAYVGKLVSLYNSAKDTSTSMDVTEYGYKTFRIAGFNHDKEHTGQENYYDLIAEDVPVYKVTAYGLENYNYRDHPIRTWYNNTYYNGFNSTIKNHMIKFVYNLNNTWYNDDYIVSPSYTEIGGYDKNNVGNVVEEGEKYNIFNLAGDNVNEQTRVRYGTDQYRYATPSTYMRNLLIRTTSSSNRSIYVSSSSPGGKILDAYSQYWNTSCNVWPMLRVH